MHLWQVSVHQLFLFSLSLFQSCPLEQKTTTNVALILVSLVLTRSGQRMTMNATIVFWTSYETKAKNNDMHALYLFSTFLSCIAENYGLSFGYFY